MDLLNENNVIHIFFNKLGDIIIANLLFILCSIPLITIGPALTAMYHCTLRTIKGNNNGTVKTFFKAFKENFVQSIIVWIAILTVDGVLFLNTRFLLHENGSISRILLYSR